ncbi:MAG: type VI secretion system tip protein VgrG [Polyangiaceae bacterium]|nr:type VI secretion system tip protein VgrG [Polyangiaceae bacterium]
MSKAPDLLAASPLKFSASIPDRLDVRNFIVRDGLSSLFTVDLEVMCENTAIDFEEMVGKPGEFRIQLNPIRYPDATQRAWSGIVSEARLLRSESSGLSTYHVTLVPALWALSHRSNCRVFQQMTDLDVVKILLDEWEIRYEVRCSGTYKTRKYRVQYQESDFTFLSRLLETAGVTYFFEADGNESVLVLSDAPERADERKQKLEFSDTPESDHIWATRLHYARAVMSGRITVSDHDHRLQNQPLLSSATPSSHPLEARLEKFQYRPGAMRFGNDGPKDTPTADDRGRTRTDAGEGKRIAEQIGSAGHQRASLMSFESNALDLGAGNILSVIGHPAAERLGKVLVTSTTISGAYDTEARLMLQTVAANRKYAPEEVTPSPRIYGIETAIVVGPQGETIHCDEFGRVRVQFHWDRYGTMDEYSSCWVPVNQAWAGDGIGSLNIPRIGQEVIVSFLGGVPEEPMIMGRMFTNLLRPPFPLPMNKTQNGFKSASVPHTGGYNELMFEDKAGSEQIRIHGEKDWDTRINNDVTLSIGRHRMKEIGGNDAEYVSGNQVHNITENMKSTVGGDKIASVLGSFMQTTSGQRVMQTTGDFSSGAKSHTISSMDSITLTVGGSTILITPDSILIQSGKILLNPGDGVVQVVGAGGTTPFKG